MPKVVAEQEKSGKENADKVTDNQLKVSEKVTDEQPKGSDRGTDKRKGIAGNVVAKAYENGDKLTSNRITILQLRLKILILQRKK